MGRILHLKITLMGSNPLIWRRFQVTESCRIDRFHQIIQIVMGWQNAHLHEFCFQDRKIGMLLDDDFDLPQVEDETELYLSDLSLGNGDTFAYLYDFGDSWEHIVDLENISDGVLPHFFCTNGERACPPEDCGGIWGYEEMLEALKDPSDPQYNDWTEWLPDDFDPGRFPREEVNDELKKFTVWCDEHPTEKSTPWHQLR